MTGSVLIYGGTKEKRTDKVLRMVSELFNKDYESLNKLKRLSDINIIQTEDGKQSIGITQAKTGTKWLTEKPFSKKYKVLIFSDADLLTVQAQNALLKTLEETPSYALIILLTKSENSLLDTVISRCKKINIITNGIPVDSEFSQEFNIIDIIGMTEGKRISVANELAKLENEDLIELIEYWLLTLRDQKNDNPAQNIKIYKWIDNLVTFKKDVEKTNINVKFGFENLFINS